MTGLVSSRMRKSCIYPPLLVHAATLQSDIRHDFAAQPFEINGFKGGQTLAISIEIVRACVTICLVYRYHEILDRRNEPTSNVQLI